MTEQRVTLEDVASSCERRGVAQEKKRATAEAKQLNNENFMPRTRSRKWHTHAAACRAAQLIVDKVRAEVERRGYCEHCTGNCGDWGEDGAEPCEKPWLSHTDECPLAALDKAERGEA